VCGPAWSKNHATLAGKFGTKTMQRWPEIKFAGQSASFHVWYMPGNFFFDCFHFLTLLVMIYLLKILYC
jgi:hypothetical protein